MLTTASHSEKEQKRWLTFEVVDGEETKPNLIGEVTLAAISAKYNFA